ncbi:MAG: hypothetical protein K2N34_15465 [Lachnospiraceae bacterium]|nr:hypothetical protein [Lachnospiraceae bacterium]
MFNGIDVSDNQGTIDWSQVQQAGIRFAILRSVRGSGKVDYQFENNFAGCRDNGIAVGVYKYSYATTVADAANEAKQVIALLNGRKLECKVWFDMEDKCQRILQKDALTEIARAFRDVILAAGYEFGIYCNHDWYNNVLNVAELNKICSYWWIARYGTNNGQVQDYYKPSIHNMTGWQYTSCGKVSGISGNVDMDQYYADFTLQTTAEVATINQMQVSNITETEYKVGQKVRFSTCYAASTDPIDKAIRADKMLRDTGTITKIAVGAANPYLIDNGLCWCNDGDIRQVWENIGTSTVAAGIKYSVGQKVRFSTCYAASTDPIDKAIHIDKMLRNTGTITKIAVGAANPYLIDNGLCWCNDGDIREILG